MRWFGVACICLATGTVWADKKLVDMTPGYEREATACEMQQSGIDIVLAKARAYAPTAPASEQPELDKDIDRLAKGQVLIAAYCTAVEDMVTFLKEHADVDAKTVQKDIDTRATAIRKARGDGKKAIEELAPITRKLIPKVNARTPQIEERRPSGKFPSGRVVELPALPGAWKLGGNAVTDIAEYTVDGATATVTTRPFTNATCDQQRKRFVSKAGDEPIADLELSAAAKAIDVQWAWRYVRHDHVPHMLTKMCVAVGTGGFVAIADVTPADKLALADDLTNLMVTMLALQLPKTAP